MDYRHLSKKVGVCGGKWCIPVLKIELWWLIEMLEVEGFTREELQKEYHITDEQFEEIEHFRKYNREK